VAEKDPTMETLAESLTTVGNRAIMDNVADSISEADIEALHQDVRDIVAAADDLDDFPYAFEEQTVENYKRKAVRAYGETLGAEEGEGIYAGPDAREMMEYAHVDPSQPIWIGTATRVGRDASIKRDRLFKHATILGPTGKGKSTLFKNIMYQLAAADNGFCFVDPKGDDSIQLMKILPEKRLNDIIWIEPDANHDYVTGFNFLEVGIDSDHPQYDTAVENLVNDLIKLLGQDNYWGPRMDQVAQTMIRAMNQSERDFNMIDMAYALRSEESRHRFASMIRQEGMPFIEDWTEEVERLDQDDLDALLRRFQPWILNPMVRRLIAFRESRINIPQAVENGKIIVVRMGSQPEEQKRMIGMAVIRRIWSAIKSRTDTAQSERNPYYLLVDEFDNIGKQNSSQVIDTMLSESRSKRLAMLLANQKISDLPPKLKDAIGVNTNAKISFGTRYPDQATGFANQLSIDRDDIINTSDYRVWLRSEDPNTGEISDAYKVYNFPSMPPVRTREGAFEEIHRSLEKWGREKQTKEEIRSDIRFDVDKGEYERPDSSPLAGGGGQAAGQRGNQTQAPPEREQDQQAEQSGDAQGEDIADQAETNDGLSEKQLDAALEGIFAAQLKADVKVGEPVSIEQAKREVERRYGDTGYMSRLANIFEKIPVEYVERGTQSSQVVIRLTSSGHNRVFHQDTGSSGSSGFPMHRMVLRRSYILFTTLGYKTYLPSQSEEDGEAPDGIADAPVSEPDIDPSTMSASEIRAELDEWETFVEEQYPDIWAVSEGDDVFIEAETSTFDKPVQTITNLRKAVNDGRTCIFATKDHKKGLKYCGRRIEEVFHDRDGLSSASEVDLSTFTLTRMIDETDDGEEVKYLYNHRTPVRFERPEKSNEEHPVIPIYPDADGSVLWRTSGEDLICEHDAHGEIIHFDSPEAYTKGEKSCLDGYYQFDPEEGEYILRWRGDKRQYPTKKELRSSWNEVKEPQIPALEFDELAHPLSRWDLRPVQGPPPRRGGA